MDPARIFTESLTPRSEIRERPGSFSDIAASPRHFHALTRLARQFRAQGFHTAWANRVILQCRKIASLFASAHHEGRPRLAD
jgi:hypothetical protein